MSTSLNKNLVPVKEVDFLDQDPPLRGQNYVCVSFISPEDVIKKKEVYFFEEFLKHISGDMTEFFENLALKYPDDAGTLKTIKERYSYLFDKTTVQNEYNFFVDNNSANLEEEYYKANDFQTSIRGLKVRGVFDTIREAEIRAQVLKKLDDKFHVYVAQVGCWCPWSPNPDDISNQEYAETQLNTMMKKYKDNQETKDVFYQERKREMQFANTKAKIEEQDAWMQQKEAAVSEQSATEPSTEQSTTVTEPVTEQSTTEPVTEQSTTEPVTEQSTTEQSTTEPINIEAL